MTSPGSPHENHEPTAAQLKHQRELRAIVAAELPELIARNQQSKQAREEHSISGCLRDAIHRSQIPLETIARKAGLPVEELDEFLTGERTLRSDVMDRIALTIDYRMPPVRAGA